MADVQPPEGLPIVLQQLVALRQKAGLTQSALAFRIGTVQSAISEMENGVASPTLATLTRYARYFDMEIVLTVAPPVSSTGEEPTDGAG